MGGGRTASSAHRALALTWRFGPWQRATRVPRFLVGAAVSSTLIVLYSLLDDPQRFRFGAVLLTAVVVSAVLGGPAMAIGAALLAFFGMWLVVLPPEWSFALDERASVLSLLSFGVSAALVVLLVAGLARQRLDAEAAARRAELLARCAQDLTAAASLEAVGEVITPVVADAFGAKVGFAVCVSSTDTVTLASLRGYPPDLTVALRRRHWASTERNPVCDALRTSERIELGTSDEIDAAYPHLAAPRSEARDAALCTTPLIDVLSSRQPLGALHLTWPHPRRLDQAEKEFLDVIVTLAELATSRIRLAEQMASDQFRSALDALVADVTFARAVRDRDGTIVDFVLEYVSPSAVDPAGRRSDSMVGRRVRELWPEVDTDGRFARYVEVVTTRQPYVEPRAHRTLTGIDGNPVDGYWSVQVSPFGDGYVAVWRDITAEVEAERELLAAREARAQELTSVQVLQQASLPAQLPDDDRVALRARYLPVTAEAPVGGDWYDAFWLDDGRLGLVVADIAGHGAAAAAHMVQLRNKLRGAAFAGAEPGVVMERLSRMASRSGTMATCCYMLVDLESTRLSWASAGHLPPALCRCPGRNTAHDAPPEVILLERPADPLLGLHERATYTTHTETFAPGELLVLYTDGLVERRREVIDVGVERLRGRLTRRATNLDDLADSLLADVAGPVRADDVCLLLAYRPDERGV